MHLLKISIPILGVWGVVQGGWAKKAMLFNKNQYYILISFSIVFGWIMSLPYEGPVLYALAEEKGIDWIFLNTLAVFFHFAGLFCGRFFAKDIISAKKIILLGIGSSVFLSLFVPFVSAEIWTYIIPLVAFMTGLVNTSNAHMIKGYIPSESRTKTAADLLIYGNIVLIAAHIFANNTRPMISFAFIELLLIGAFILAFKIDTGEKLVRQPIVEPQEKSVFKSYWILFLFIFVITINSGIMFQVIYPYFGQFELLTSIYTNIPYIVAIYLLSRSLKNNKFYFLYIGLALWGITFILFALLGQTALSFILICSVMLFAAGIFDFFWWSIMANSFDNVENPASLFGFGLSVNVLGVWAGGLIGNYLISIGVDKQGLSYTGLLVVMVSMLIIVPLNGKLAALLENNEFLVKVQYLEKKKMKTLLEEAELLLSKRELEVFNLLITGKTNTQISEELYLSPHTIKTHSRNIYKKLNVANKIELIEKVSETP